MARSIVGATITHWTAYEYGLYLGVLANIADLNIQFARLADRTNNRFIRMMRINRQNPSSKILIASQWFHIVSSSFLCYSPTNYSRRIQHQFQVANWQRSLSPFDCTVDGTNVSVHAQCFDIVLQDWPKNLDRMSPSYHFDKYIRKDFDRYTRRYDQYGLYAGILQSPIALIAVLQEPFRLL